MFNYLITFSQYIKLFCNISLFSYIYKYFFDHCNDKIQITTKNKKKNAIKSKITLSLIYFTLLTVIYFTISLRFFITILCAFGLSSLLLLDKFDPTSIEILTKYDNHKTLRLGWKVFYTFINLIFMCLEPLHKQMTNKLKHYYKKAKKFIMNKLSENKEDGGEVDIMNLLFKNDNIKENDVQEHIKDETNNKINREVLSSTMSDYVVNNNISANQKKNLLNSKENLLNNKENEIDEMNVNDIINKIINLRSDETTEEIKEIKEIKEITTNESKTTQEEKICNKDIKEDLKEQENEEHEDEEDEEEQEDEFGEDKIKKMQEMMSILNKMNEIFNSDVNEEQ